MRRDMDLVRDILLKMEDHESLTPSLDDLVISGVTEPRVRAHLDLMQQEGFVRIIHPEMRGEDETFSLLTGGHTFLAAARDATTWNKAKAQLGKTFESAGIPAIFAVLIKIAVG